MSQSRSVVLRIRTRILSPRRLYVNLKKSSFARNQEHVLTPASCFLAYHLANCGLSGTSSPMNSCYFRILNLYSPNVNWVPLTIPSAWSPRTPVDLSQIHHHSTLEILSTLSQTRTSHLLVTTTLSSPLMPPGVSWRASSYKVKLSECFPMSTSTVVSHHPSPSTYQGKDEEPLPVAPAAPSVPVQPTLSPSAPPQITTMPSDDDTMLDVPFHTLPPTFIPEEPCTNVVATDQSLSSSGPCSSPEPSGPRLQIQRRSPSYLNDYVRF